MNTYQQKIYNELSSLVETNEAFFFHDWEYDGATYRNFNYRLASYTDFCQPSSLECRGIMFEIDTEDKPVRLASFPFAKFFNMHENPFTMDLDLSKVVEIADKADGSLITTYTHYKNGEPTLRVKTKGSIGSEQAMATMAYIARPENHQFAYELTLLEHMGFTTIMEWCAPDNRIVLPYKTAHLKVLGIRSRNDGSYLHYEDAEEGGMVNEVLSRWTTIIKEDPVEFISTVEDLQNIEGVVVRMEDGQRIKIKCSWYLALHHTKDSITIPRRLFECVLEEASDDLRALFYDDELAIQMIEEMEVFVEGKYNHMVDTVERFYERNKHMERKDYAILGQSELDKGFFGLAMQKYLGNDIDYKAFLKKQWKKLGLKDEKVEAEEQDITIAINLDPPE